MAKYLGNVKIRGTYYNFQPVYEIQDNGGISALQESDYKELLPDSYLNNINFYYPFWDFKESMEDYFDESQAVVVDFSTDELELNYSGTGEINPTRYKISAFEKIKEGKITSPEDNGIYRVIRKEYVDLKDGLNKDVTYIDIDGIDLYKGMKVYLEIPENRFFMGPYEVKYRPANERFYVLTKLKEKNYLAEGYNMNSVKLLRPIEIEGIEYIKPNEDAQKYYEDLIDDQNLIKGFKESVKGEYLKDGRLNLSNVEKLHNYMTQSPFLLKVPNEIIRKNRIKRLKEILTVTKSTEESIREIAGTLGNTFVENLINESGEKAEWFEKLQKQKSQPKLTEAKANKNDASKKASNKALIDSRELTDYICKTTKTVRPGYEDNFIINMIISIFQNRLTVFSGKPGCGKTSICNIIAQTFGLKQLENRFISVSVERGWTSKNDFVGYYNPLTEKFDEKNKGVLNALKLADAEYKSKQYKYPILFLLDEANLSPIEYYWADFMNTCDDVELPGEINIGGGDALIVPENVHFVATINNDHTTETLSPRLIDRASIITLPEIKNAKINHSKINDTIIKTIDWGSIKETFLNTANDEDELPATYKKIIDLFDEMDIYISTRTNISVKKYYSTARRLFVEDELGREIESIIIDYAIAQRILPKINGYGDRFNEWLNELCEMLKQHQLTHSLKLVEEILSRGNMGMNYYQFFA